MYADPFLHSARINKPYMLLWEPTSGQAAAYDAHLRLVTERASAELVAFAQQRHVHCEPWDELQGGVQNCPLPSWAGDATLKRCTLYWLRDGWSKFRDLLETPDA